jgi:hypothetical protein
MLRPSAASEKIRNGSMMVISQYSLDTTGITKNAISRMIARPIRSCRIGKIA